MQLAESKTEEDFAISYEAIMRDIASQVPSTFLDKWNAWRYMAMLANPVTMIRNLVGNAFFAPTVMTKNLLATTFESTKLLIIVSFVAQTEQIAIIDNRLINSFSCL